MKITSLLPLLLVFCLPSLLLAGLAPFQVTINPVKTLYNGRNVDLSCNITPRLPNATYQWAITSTPDNVIPTIIDADKPVASFIPTVYGIYNLTLTVTQGSDQATAKLSVHVIQNPVTDRGYNFDGANKIPYKTAKDLLGGSHTLNLHVFRPADWQRSDKRPAILFFHGGGWNTGSPARYVPDCLYFASRGIVAITAEYRLGQRHGTSPAACIADARSAIRYLRGHAAELGLDPNRIVAAGESAGGHIAACTATLTTGDDPADDKTISCIPNGLALYFPVLDRPQSREADLAPLHFVNKTTPPTLLLVGEEDGLSDPWCALDWAKRMDTSGQRCRVLIYRRTHHPTGAHDLNNPVENDLYRQVDLFLQQLGYLQGAVTMPDLTPQQVAKLYVTPEAFRIAHPTPVRPLQPTTTQPAK